MPGALVTAGRLFRLFAGLRVRAGVDGLFGSGIHIYVPAGHQDLHQESRRERHHQRQHQAAFVQYPAHRRKGPGIKLEQQNHVSSTIDLLPPQV